MLGRDEDENNVQEVADTYIPEIKQAMTGCGKFHVANLEIAQVGQSDLVGWSLVSSRFELSCKVCQWAICAVVCKHDTSVSGQEIPGKVWRRARSTKVSSTSSSIDRLKAVIYVSCFILEAVLSWCDGGRRGRSSTEQTRHEGAVR